MTLYPDQQTLYTRDYLPREVEERSFVIGPDGLPTGRLVQVMDRLVIRTDDDAGLVNPSSTRLPKLGIFIFALRGLTYHDAAVKAGDYSLGAPLRLVREPDLKEDPHAIAVFAGEALKPGGYVNRQNAARLAPRIDAGESLMAISVRGDRPRVLTVAPWALVAAPAVVEHLRRR